MAYEPTVWKDRVVERPRTFNIQNNPDGTVTLIPAPGVIVESGTPVNAVNLNKLEQGLKTHEADITKHGGITGIYIDSTTSIAADAELTISIPLGLSATRGRVVIHNPPKNKGLLGIFGTSPSNFIRLGHDAGSSGSYNMRTYFGEITSRNTVFGGTLNFVLIKTIYIDGTDLKIVFKNTGTEADTISVIVSWEVQ